MIWHLILKPIYNLLYGDRRAERIEWEIYEANHQRQRVSDQAEMRRQLVERWQAEVARGEHG